MSDRRAGRAADVARADEREADAGSQLAIPGAGVEHPRPPRPAPALLSSTLLATIARSPYLELRASLDLYRAADGTEHRAVALSTWERSELFPRWSRRHAVYVRRGELERVRDAFTKAIDRVERLERGDREDDGGAT